MLRSNPLLPIVEKAIGAPCGFSEDRRKIYFSVDATVDNVLGMLKKACEDEEIKVDLNASVYILPIDGGTMVQIEN